MDCDDVGMVQRAGGLGLLDEAGFALWIGDPLRRLRQALGGGLGSSCVQAIPQLGCCFEVALQPQCASVRQIAFSAPLRYRSNVIGVPEVPTLPAP